MFIPNALHVMENINQPVIDQLQPNKNLERLRNVERMTISVNLVDHDRVFFITKVFIIIMVHYLIGKVMFRQNCYI